MYDPRNLILITGINGAIDDLYQKKCTFKNYFFPCLTVDSSHNIWGTFVAYDNQEYKTSLILCFSTLPILERMWRRWWWRSRGPGYTNDRALCPIALWRSFTPARTTSWRDWCPPSRRSSTIWTAHLRTWDRAPYLGFSSTTYFLWVIWLSHDI